MTGALVVQSRRLVKRFSASVTAVDGLDLAIAAGETFGLLGPNGAGKTITLRMLLGLVRPTSGSIRVIRQLGAEGRTVVLSSHDMDEVEDLCSRVAVIGGGRMLAEGSPEQLRGQPRLWLRAEPADQAAAVAATLAGVARAELADGLLGLDLRDSGAARAAAVNRGLVGAGLEVSEVRTARRPLREVLLELTSGRTGGADSLRHRTGRRAARRPRRQRQGPAGKDS